MEYKAIPSEAKFEDERTVTGLASVFGNVDSYGDIVMPGAFRKTLKERTSRVKHLWMHNPMEPPIAAIKGIREVGRDDLPDMVRKAFPDATGGLEVTREYLPTQRGNEVLAGIKAGAISEMSFGFDVVKWEQDEGNAEDRPVRKLKEVRLWDTSDVTWGANEATIAAKAALPFVASPKAPEDAEWDGPMQMGMCEGMADLKAICAWVDPEGDPETKSSYKLPHHMAGEQHAVVWSGVRAAMGALMGGRGGVDIPDGDRRAVYNHLAKHYTQFDKEPPDFKAVELLALSRDLMLPDALKAGRVLSERNLKRLKDALAVLNDILMAAEPPDQETAKALTEQRARRLQLALNELELLSEV